MGCAISTVSVSWGVCCFCSDAGSSRRISNATTPNLPSRTSTTQSKCFPLHLISTHLAPHLSGLLRNANQIILQSGYIIVKLTLRLSLFIFVSMRRLRRSRRRF